MKNKSGISGNYLKTLGLADEKSGTPLVSESKIFTKDASGSYTGEMWLPCRMWTDSIYADYGPKAKEVAERNCLEPLRNVDTTAAIAQLYTLPVYNLNRYTSPFDLDGDQNIPIVREDELFAFSVNFQHRTAPPSRRRGRAERDTRSGRDRRPKYVPHGRADSRTRRRRRTRDRVRYPRS